MTGPDPFQPPAGVVLLSRQGCHLCADAARVMAAAAAATGAEWREIDVDDDPELQAEWGDMVPVVLVDGRCVAYYRVEQDRLVTAIRQRSEPRAGS